MYKVRFKKKLYLIYPKDPHIQSQASQIMLRHLLKLQSRPHEPKYKTWLRFRKKYLRKQKKLNKGNLTCFFCKESYLDMNFNNPFRKRPRKRATVDHMTPRSKGGKEYDENNLCVCCRECNELKANTSLEEFQDKVNK